MEKLLPPNEHERLEALKAYEIMDTFPEEDLDAITRLASEICQTPIALISLIDENRQWFKSNVGLAATETPRDISFCQHTIMGDTIYEVPNAEKSQLFKNNVFVTGDPNIRFYAGAPLVNPEGYKLGSLCVIDTVPKQLNEKQKETLATLSKLVINQFELRRKKIEIEDTKNQYLKMIENAGDIIYTTDEKGRFQYISNAVTKITGYTPSQLKGEHFTYLVTPESKKEVALFYIQQFKKNVSETSFEFQILMPEGNKKWVEQNVVTLYEGHVLKGFQGIVRDISQRKEVEFQLARANKLIEETKKTLQSILDNTSSVIFIKDLQGRYTMINRQFEKVFNVAFSDVYQKNDYEFRNKTDAATLQQHDKEVFEKQKPLDFEYAFIINGMKRTFLITKFPLHDDTGHMYGLCGVYTEITAQKKVETLLRERDERFSKIFHSSPAAMVLGTLSPNRFLEVNDSFTELTGYTQQEIIGKNASEIGMLGDSDREELLKHFTKTGSLKNYEMKFLDKQGNEKYVLLSTEIIEIEGAIHILSLYYDITSRKQSEKELANARALLVEAMSIGRMGTFENNVKDQKITWSKEIYNIMEMPYDDAPLGYDQYIKAIYPDDLPMVMRKIETSFIHKQPDVTINRFISRTGKIKWIETRVLPVLDENGEIMIFRGTMQDITELKETEQQLRTAKELAEQSVIAKEQFLANMSHEIRTPMNGVLGFTELLSKTKLEKEQAGFVRAIETSGKNLMAIINDILDYSKIEAGMLSIDETLLSIQGIFGSLAVLFSDRVKQKKLKLSFKADKNIPDEVVGDPVRLTQIITNLVNNSIKFTEHGSVDVSAKLLERTPETIKVLFCVKDTGIGIPKEKLAAVFERFNQGSNDTTRKYGGTGLGLSIVKKLAELQGGSVSVESTLHKGSVFSVELTYKISKQIKNTLPSKTGKTRQNKLLKDLSILLAEDNLLNQKLAEKVLTGFGFKVDIAGNGKIAVNKFRKKAYDIILMDMQMPEMNGYEATEVIRKKLNSNIPIIAMTAHAMGSEKEKCLALGMNDYISKPFRADDLYSKISEIYNKHKKNSETPAKKTSPVKNKNTVKKAKALVNLDYLVNITGGNKEFINEMLELVLTELPADLAQIDNAIAKKDFQVIKSIAHKLKSTVPMIGLGKDVLASLAEIELQAAAGTKLSQIKKLFAGVNDLGQRAIDEILSARTPDGFEF